MSVRIYNAVEYAADLYSRIPGDGEFDIMVSNETFGDIPFALWQYAAGSSATDNFNAETGAGDVIQPTLQTGNGRWLKRGTYGASPQAPSQSTDTRSLDTVFQVSETRGAFVTFCLSAVLVGVLGGNKNVSIVLQIRELESSGAWQDIATFQEGVQGIVTTLTKNGSVTGFIPAGWWAQLALTTINTGIGGSATGGFVSGQKTLI